MGQRRLRDLDAQIIARYPACWFTVTRFVLGLGIGVIVALALLVRPWAMAVLLALAGLLLPGRATIAAAWRELLPIGQLGNRLLGLFVATVAACCGWQLLLGPSGLAVVAVDALAGLPVLLRLTSKHGRQSAPTIAPATRLRLVLGPDPQPVPRQRGRVPVGLDELSPALSETVPPGEGQPRLLEELSDAELRHAWQASCRALLMVNDPAVTQRIVEARGRYLDAMAQRDPQRFTLWALSSLNATQPLQDGSEPDH